LLIGLTRWQYRHQHPRHAFESGIMKATLTIAGLAWLMALGTGRSAPEPGDTPHDCDFAAVLMKTGYIVPDTPQVNDPPGPSGPYDDPDDFFYDYITQRSSASSNPNGYGICYARLGQTMIDRRTQVWNSPNQVYSANPDPLDTARAAILDPRNQAWMVMAHSRMGTIGGAQQHPYYLDWNGRTYALMHNGNMQHPTKRPLFWDLWNNYGHYGQWWEEHPSNWNPGPSNYAGFCGTELLFHWIMRQVIAAKGDFAAGFQNAMTMTVSNQNGMINLREAFKDPAQNSFNVVMFDGTSLWIYRNTSTNGGNISYKDFGKFIGIKTRATMPGGVQVKQYSLLHILRSGQIIEYPNLSDSELPPVGKPVAKPVSTPEARLVPMSQIIA
jgi:hypothetical protein